jgi:hypothetical protein
MKKLILGLMLLWPAAARAQAPTATTTATTATPAATVDGGASVSVQVEPNGDTTLDVKRGDVAVKANGGKPEHVGAGETVRVQKNQPLKRLPPPPVLLAPADGTTLSALDVAFSWQPVPGANRYLMEIAPDPQFQATRTQTVAGPATRVTLDAGSTYFWRVTVLDGGGTPGRRGQPWHLTIDTTPPKLKAGRPKWR